MTLMIGLAGATPSGPLPTLTLVDADCEETPRPATELTVVFREVVMSCAGPRSCSELSSRPLDGRTLRVTVEEKGPLEGVFEQTDRTCSGAPVWRFTAPLPPGARIRIHDDRTISRGWYHVRDAE